MELMLSGLYIHQLFWPVWLSCRCQKLNHLSRTSGSEGPGFEGSLWPQKLSFGWVLWPPICRGKLQSINITGRVWRQRRLSAWMMFSLGSRFQEEQTNPLLTKFDWGRAVVSGSPWSKDNELKEGQDEVQGLFAGSNRAWSQSSSLTPSVLGFLLLRCRHSFWPGTEFHSD